MMNDEEDMPKTKKQKNDEEDTADWLVLPSDLLYEITFKVTSSSLEDHIRFGCICVEWRSFFLEKNFEQIKLSNLPVLLIPSPSLDHHHHTKYQKDRVDLDLELEHLIIYNYYSQRKTWLGMDPKERHTSTRSFYSLSEKKVYDFQLQVPTNLHCRGSSHGWLLLVEECPDGTLPVHLFNPFRSSKNKIQLPPLTTPPLTTHTLDTNYASYFLRKCIFARDPSSSSSSSSNLKDDFIVLGLDRNGDMLLCRPGDLTWTLLSFRKLGVVYDIILRKLGVVYDIVCYKGQFWAIVLDGTVFAFDIYPKFKVKLTVDPHQDDSIGKMRYLVESAGDLFNVRRNYSDLGEDIVYTLGFHVFKLDQTKMEWVKTYTLDGRMFFLGTNASISLPPSESCKPNSIYFTDDYDIITIDTPWDAPHDIGVFNLEDGSLEPHYKSEFEAIMPAPIWIQPMLSGF